MALGARELLLILRARDEASRVINSVARSMTDLDATTRAAAQRQINAGVALTSMGVGIIGVGAAMAGALHDATAEAATFENAIALVSTQTDKVKASQKELGDIVMDVGKRTAVPIEQLSAGLYDIFSSMDVNLPQAKIMLEQLAKSAVAGQTSLETAGRATIAIMNAWKIPAEDVSKVLDVQFKLVQKGIGTYDQFATAIGKAVPSAQRAGQSVETLAGMMAYLTRNGLSADMAAASAARAFDALANPTVIKRLEKMGIEVRDANGGFKDMGSIMTDLQKKFADMTDPERANALQALFKGAGGTIQARRFYDLVLKDSSAVNAFTGFVGDMQDASGSFTEAYDTMADTATSKSQILQNNWDAMKIQIGQALLPLLKNFTDMLIGLFSWWDKLSDGTKDTIAQFMAFAAALTIVIGFAVTLVGLWVLLSGAAAILGVGIGALIGIVGAVAAIIVGLIAVGYLLYKNWDTVTAAIVKAWDWVLNRLSGVWQWIKDTIGDKVIALFNKVKTDVMGAIGPMADFVVEMWKKITDWAAATWPAIQGFIQPFIDWWMKVWPDVKDILEAVLNIIVDAFRFTWEIVVGVLKGAWEIIKGIVEGIWDIFTGLIDLIIGIFTGDWERAWNGVWEILKGFWDIILGFILGVWELIKGMFEGGMIMVKSVWENGLSIVVDIAKIAWDSIVTGVKNFWDWLVNTFHSGVNMLGDIWDTIVDIMKTPINFVIEHVYNNGIVAMWNAIADFLGLGHLSTLGLIGQSTPGLGGGSGRPMLAMAKGGILPGYSPGVDNLIVAMSGGEGVLVPEAVRGLGPGFVHWANSFYSGGRAGSGGSVGKGFADGGIVDTVMSFASGVGDTVGAIFHDPIGFITSKIGSNPFIQGVGALISKSVDGIIDKVWNMIGSAFSGGPASGELDQWIKLAMGIAGVGADWYGPLLTLIMRESGGNPNAINLWDSNAQAGYPSQGLMQTIPQTFAAYRDQRLPNEITNPIANIVAGINYIKSVYGSIFNVQQAVGSTPKGYDAGGVMPPGLGMFFNGTGTPEAVLTTEQWAMAEKAINQAEGRGSMGAGTGYGVSIVINNYDIEMTIVTQEIDPRGNALELGREITKGVGVG